MHIFLLGKSDAIIFVLLWGCLMNPPCVFSLHNLELFRIWWGTWSHLWRVGVKERKCTFSLHPFCSFVFSLFIMGTDCSTEQLGGKEGKMVTNKEDCYIDNLSSKLRSLSQWNIAQYLLLWAHPPFQKREVRKILTSNNSDKFKFSPKIVNWKFPSTMICLPQHGRLQARAVAEHWCQLLLQEY